MFDPEVDLDPRLASEFGFKRGDVAFYPKVDCDEQELKYTTASFDKIRSAVHNANNRRVDARAWTSNPYALVTLNLDTADRQLARAGYSLRVRFAYDGDNKITPISQIDMSIKTSLPTGTNVIMFNQTRGEWEAPLKTLKPSLAAMIEENKDSKRPLPDFFKDGHLKDDDFIVETIGCTLRNIYPSYERFQRHGKTLVTAFQHTEDVMNIFMTPYADVITGQDSEAESEFLGIYNLTDKDVTPEKYEQLMRKSMELLDRVIVTADPGNVQRNLMAKSVRARNALEICYGPSKEIVLREQFDDARRIDEAVKFSLSQNVKPEEVNFGNIWHHVAAMKVKVERMMTPVDDTFQPAKYNR